MTPAQRKLLLAVAEILAPIAMYKRDHDRLVTLRAEVLAEQRDAPEGGEKSHDAQIS